MVLTLLFYGVVVRNRVSEFNFAQKAKIWAETRFLVRVRGKSESKILLSP